MQNVVSSPVLVQRGAGREPMVGQFLIKDSVFLGAALLATAESLRAARTR